MESPFDAQLGREYARVTSVDAFVAPGNPNVPVMILHLEDGLDLTLYYVPFEIVEAINSYNGVDISIENVIGSDRESIFDLLVTHDDLRNVLTDDLAYVVIDELDSNTMLFTAKVVFSNGKMKVERRMIPSHAVFLAYISGKPIYVKRELAQHQLDETQDYSGE